MRRVGSRLPLHLCSVLFVTCVGLAACRPQPAAMDSGADPGAGPPAGGRSSGGPAGDCVANRPCHPAQIPDCPPGLRPSPLFTVRASEDTAPSEWLSPSGGQQVVAARLDWGLPVFDLMKCSANNACCSKGRSTMGLTSDLTEQQARVVGIENQPFPASNHRLMVRLLLKDGPPPQCQVDQTGWCCTFPQDALGQLVLARGNRSDATTLEQATLCHPRAPDYDLRKLQLTTPGLHHIEEEMAAQ